MRTPEVKILEDRAQDYCLIGMLDSGAGLELEEDTRYGQSMRTPEVRILEDRAQDYWLIRIIWTLD